MHAFVVRPFGVQESLSGQTIDFDRVERELILPALGAVGVQGGTTASFVEAGNIRSDMFEQLLKAGLVIADLSIHNANVFYELGIRHALRDKRTYLIRCAGDEIPFDLKTDRYLAYDPNDPKAVLPILIEGLRKTLDGRQSDSPVYRLLPTLKAQDWSQYLVVPEDFGEAVELALEDQSAGDLELFATEVKDLSWELEGLRLVGRALFQLKAFESARSVWEAVVEQKEGDNEGYAKLATIYQRLGFLPESNLAIERALGDPNLTTNEVAELHALRGSNEKSRWLAAWSKHPNEQHREAALESPFLMRAYDAYQRGFEENLSHFYPGLNALALMVVITDLAAALPEIWLDQFGSDEEGEQELQTLNKRRAQLAEVVGFSIEVALRKCKTAGQSDIWADISWADYLCLTSSRPRSVALAYREALFNAKAFILESVQRQLSIYQLLGLQSENVNAALTALAELECTPAMETQIGRVLLFTGHMIDQPGRSPERFPGDQNAEQKAKAAIREAVAKELAATPGEVVGIAGGACGGDILFHEVCAELGIPTRLYLALPQNQFKVTSVQHGGADWIRRFDLLCESLPTRVLADSKKLPRWLSDKKEYSIWQRNNLWTLHHALAYGGGKVTLIALWDGEPGDNVGGTADMIRKAQARGAVKIILDTKSLFGLNSNSK